MLKISSNRYKAFLFDMDGTLVDSEPTHFKALGEVLKGYGKSYVDWETHKKVYTGTGITNVSKIEAERNNLDEDPTIIQDKFHTTVEKIIQNEGLTPMKGSFDFINKAKELGLRIAVVSGSTTNLVEYSMGKSGYSGIFETIIGLDKFEIPKPDPAGYILAAKTLGVKPEECLAFEDAPNGLLSAKNAGMDVIAVGETITDKRIKEIDPNIKHIKDFTEIEII